MSTFVIRIVYLFNRSQTALIAVCYLTLLLVQTTIKNASGDFPFNMKIVLVVHNHFLISGPYSHQ